jgi:hypothetical protein
MTLVRLLVVFLPLCSLVAIAQDSPGRAPSNTAIFNCLTSGVPTTSSEPWRIIASRTPDSEPSQKLEDHVRQAHKVSSSSRPECQDGYLRSSTDAGIQLAWRSGTGADTSRIGSPALEDDPTCYTIRTYVVARDGKDSDSTHPVRYSTCAPAERYKVKTAETRIHSRDR